MDRKRVRRGESFGRLGVDRTISNSLKSPSRQKQRCGGDSDASSSSDDTSSRSSSNDSHSVRFAEETPLIHLCSHYEEGMTNDQVEQRKTELWYSRADFEAFLKERVATIRLLKVVQGDASALRTHCPDLCLRGLEPYSCNTLNQEMQCQRQLHLRVVLAEQDLQKSSKVDPERIRVVAQERSEWARIRARQLGSLDEMEVITGGGGAGQAPTLDDNLTIAMSRRRSLASAQLGIERLMLNQQPQARVAQPRRATLSHITPAAAQLNPLGLSARRVPVDLAILKEWNAKFLADIRGKAQTPTTNTINPAAPPIGIKSLSDKTAESRRALNVWSTGLLPNNSALFMNNAAHGSTGTTLNAAPVATNPLGYGEQLITPRNAAAASATNGSNKEATAPAFRFPLRRDSLVGLRRESFLAGRPAPEATKVTLSTTNGASFSNDRAPKAPPSAADPSTSGLNTLAEACFRFPVRRDSLSNVHWN